ncbi:small integral membrane protein 30 [Coregonus clupeaformis]|uniref:small integral membrane protein 30 n=1 Tax=Coregonus clupeaformis TaxID=59861 RepID=UPI001E1C8655|nr:small integral membrane protein 30 [Coregonus clupeaformis]
MAAMPELPKVPATLFVMFLSLIPSAEAFDGGDAVALLLGVTISVVGVCACIGWYARQKNGQF